ncbi:MAG TPA: hypothetical protein VFG33_39135 [Kribbella sp.]|uniref:hypothetical protein n=1 Tax=Kribbella sp. TaxID=1871183 RepID=UPI002D778650|nr:hypothetical protein [Kribbella sp.]HET6299446.1 hypothetical protein [Kribbella sp.]
MAEDTSASGTPLPFVEDEADGYCDLETGVCVSPGAENPDKVLLVEVRPQQQ